MYITEEEFKNLTLESLNAALERVHNKAIEDTLRLLPDVIVGLVVKTKGMQNSMEEFKKLCPGIDGREAELIEIIQDLELEDGTLTLDEILKKVPEKMKDITQEVPAEQPHTVEALERTCNGFI